ncbi:MAG: hypothetical protein ACXWDL_15920 [Nocardioides sp.]
MRHHEGPSSATVVHPARLMLPRLRPSGIDSLPTRGSRIDLAFGPPVTIDARAWPRSKGLVRDASMLLRERLLETLDDARARTGRDLPGPLPAGLTEDDPATGLVDEEPR